jgi:hypothetical protein
VKASATIERHWSTLDELEAAEQVVGVERFAQIVWSGWLPVVHRLVLCGGG